jgi:hypothetical protein
MRKIMVGDVEVAVVADVEVVVNEKMKSEAVQLAVTRSNQILIYIRQDEFLARNKNTCYPKRVVLF